MKQSDELAFHAQSPSQPWSLDLKELSSLRASYMPLFSQGGLFIASSQSFQLGDEITLQLELPDEAQIQTVTGQVAWITPVNASHGQRAGIGVSFPDNAQGHLLQARILALLGPQQEGETQAR